jgi:hypothetical protein
MDTLNPYAYPHVQGGVQCACLSLHMACAPSLANEAMAKWWESGQGAVPDDIHSNPLCDEDCRERQGGVEEHPPCSIGCMIRLHVVHQCKDEGCFKVL